MFVFYKYYILIEMTFLKKYILTRQANICQYLSLFVFFLHIGFKFHSHVCNGCHELLMMSMNLSDIAILNIKSAEYRCIITGISYKKSEAIKLLQNIDLTEKNKTL